MTTLAVVRVYSTHDRYDGGPVPGAPVGFDVAPGLGGSVEVDLGPIPERVRDAWLLGRVIAEAMLRGLFAPQRRAELRHALGQPATVSEEDLPWNDDGFYVTITHVRAVDFSLIEGVDIAFATEAVRRGEDLIEESHALLDTAAALGATAFGSRLFQERTLEMAMLSASGRRSAYVPVVTVGGFTGSVRGDVDQFTAAVKQLKGYDIAALVSRPWLAKSAHWRMQSLVETDPWKRLLLDVPCS